MTTEEILCGKRVIINQALDRAHNEDVEMEDLEADFNYFIVCYEKYNVEHTGPSVNRAALDILDGLYRRILIRLGEMSESAPATESENQLVLF